MRDDIDETAMSDRLNKRRAEIIELQDISSNARETVELDQSSVGRVSRIDAMQSQQLALATERQRQDELHRIEAALQRIADGTFGICVICDEDIAAKRLEFDPSLPTCIGCASTTGR